MTDTQLQRLFKEFVEKHCVVKLGAYVNTELFESAFNDFCKINDYHQDIGLYELIKMIKGVSLRVKGTFLIGIDLQTYPVEIPDYLAEFKAKVKRVMDLSTTTTTKLSRSIPQEIIDLVPANARDTFDQCCDSMFGGTTYNPTSTCCLLDMFIDYHGHELSHKVIEFFSEYLRDAPKKL